MAIARRVSEGHYVVHGPASSATFPEVPPPGSIVVDTLNDLISTYQRGGWVSTASASSVTQTRTVTVAAVAEAADGTTLLGVAPFAGFVSSVSFIASSTLTGQATNFRTLGVKNLGAAGDGTTVVASLAFSSAPVVATALVPKAITLSAVESATAVASGDVLQWTSVHTLTGLADPGGVVVVTFTRT